MMYYILVTKMTPDNPSLRKFHRTPGFIVSAFILLGAIGLIHYIEMPIVRNAMVYARITYAMIDFGGDFSVSKHGYDKALGFPSISIPFVQAFGANVGLKIVSFIGTTLWLISAIFFFRHLRDTFHRDIRDSPDPRLLALVLCLNPLVYHQFGSAYADPFNALLFLWALYFLDRMTSEAGRWFDGILFVVATGLAISVKHHGLVLSGVLVVFVFCRIGILKKQWQEQRAVVSVTIISILLLFLFIGSARAGWIPFFNLHGALRDYSTELDKFPTHVLKSFRGVKDYLWLSFSFIIPLFFYWKNFAENKHWYLTILVFWLPLMLFKGTSFNPRHFLPIAPLLVWIICSNLSAMPRQFKHIFVSVFIVVNGFFTLYYNQIEIKQIVDKIDKFSNHDNLRLVGEQLTHRKRIDAINRRASDGEITLFFARSYYVDAMWHVWERDGLFNDKLKIVYLGEAEEEIRHIVMKYVAKHELKEALLFTGPGFDRTRLPVAVEVRTIDPQLYSLTF